MRELKFRAWNKELNKWCYDKIHMFIDLDGKPINMQNCGREDVYIVNEYIGLKDKNGKEIYEGDIYKEGLVESAIIKWKKDLACFVMDWTHESKAQITWSMLESEYEDCHTFGEVIGNIYENPELLQANQEGEQKD